MYFTKVILILFFLFSCQKEMRVPQSESNEKTLLSMQGVWKFVYYKQDANHYVDNSVPCWADNTFEIKGDSGIISQGQCISFPNEPKEERFVFRFLPDGTINMGGNVITLVTLNDSVFSFKQIDPYFEYKWKK